MFMNSNESKDIADGITKLKNYWNKILTETVSHQNMQQD